MTTAVNVTKKVDLINLNKTMEVPVKIKNTKGAIGMTLANKYYDL